MRTTLSFLFALVMSASTIAPANAEACKRWTIPSQLTFFQSNDYYVLINVKQIAAGHFSGVAQYPTHGRPNFLGIDKKVLTIGGKMVGHVTPAGFEMTIFWEIAGGGSVGVYTAQVSADGGVTGRTYDKAKPGNSATFYAATPVQCTSI